MRDCERERVKISESENERESVRMRVSEVEIQHSVTAYHIVSFYEQKSLSLNVTAKK